MSKNHKWEHAEIGCLNGIYEMISTSPDWEGSSICLKHLFLKYDDGR